MARRKFLAQLSTLPFLAWGTKAGQIEPSKKSLKIVMKSAWGPDGPTRASFPFAHGLHSRKLGIRYRFSFSLKPHP